jgi:hypothetical protein
VVFEGNALIPDEQLRKLIVTQARPDRVGASIGAVGADPRTLRRWGIREARWRPIHARRGRAGDPAMRITEAGSSVGTLSIAGETADRSRDLVGP